MVQFNRIQSPKAANMLEVEEVVNETQMREYVVKELFETVCQL